MGKSIAGTMKTKEADIKANETAQTRRTWYIYEMLAIQYESNNE